MSVRITKALVERMKPGDQIWDADIKGFGIRHQDGSPSYMLKTRSGGRQRWVQFGKHGSPWTVETARREALQLLSAAKQGHELKPGRIVVDPEAPAPAIGFSELAEAYLAGHGPKLKARTREEHDRMLRLTLLPGFGTRAAAAITKADIVRFHSRTAETPRKANFALAILSSIINWGIEHGQLPADTVNPCLRIKKFKERARERYLSSDEIARLLALLDEEDRRDGAPGAVTTAIRLLLLTGARLNEILSLRWSFVDLDRATLWLPDSKTGKKAIHLSPQAIAVLERNPYVITGERAGAHLVNLQKPWRRLRARAGLEDVRTHDLRHSYASIAINSGASLSMVGKLLGHRQPQTTMRYAHLADDPLRQLNNRIGASIAAVSGGGQEGEGEQPG